MRTFWHPLEMPPYFVAKFKPRGGPADWSEVQVGHIWLESLKVVQSYSFKLRESGKNVWEVQCGSGSATGDVNYVAGKSTIESRTSERKTLQCILSQPGTNTSWTLEIATSVSSPVLSFSGEAKGEGRLTNGQQQFAVYPEFHLEGFSFAASFATGFVITAAGKPVAAVDTSPPGRLIVSTSSVDNDRTLFAAVAAAILLQPEAPW